MGLFHLSCDKEYIISHKLLLTLNGNKRNLHATGVPLCHDPFTSIHVLKKHVLHGSYVRYFFV